MAADSTMLRIVNLLMALSFGVHLEQLEHRIGLTCPRPFLLRPLYDISDTPKGIECPYSVQTLTLMRVS